MTEIEMLKKENQLLKEQIELYKKLLEEKDKKKEKEYIPYLTKEYISYPTKEYIPYPTYPNLGRTPQITWEGPTCSSESWDNFVIKCKNGDA